MKELTLAVLLIASLAHAGTTWTWTSSSGEAKKEIVVKCQADSVRLEVGDRLILWDGKKNVWRTFSKRTRTSVEQTKQELEAVGSKRRETHFENLARYAPKEKRAALEAEWIASERNAWKLTPLGQLSEQAAFSCELHSGLLGREERTFCLVPWKSAPREGVACMKSFWAAIEAQGPVGSDLAVLGSLQGWPGYPVRMEYTDDDETKVMSLEKVTTEVLPAETFRLP